MISIYIDSCNFVKLSPLTHISERSCEWKEREIKIKREKEKKNSTRRLRKRDFQDVVRKERPRSSSPPPPRKGFGSRVRNKGRRKKKEFLRKKRGKNDEIKKERENIDIHPSTRFKRDKEMRGRIMTDEIPY